MLAIPAVHAQKAIPVDQQKDFDNSVEVFSGFSSNTTAAAKSMGDAKANLGEALQKIGGAADAKAAGENVQYMLKEYDGVGIIVPIKNTEADMLKPGDVPATMLKVEEARRKKVAAGLKAQADGLQGTVDALKKAAGSLNDQFREKPSASNTRFLLGSSFYSRDDLEEGDDSLLDDAVPYGELQWRYRRSNAAGCGGFWDAIAADEFTAGFWFENRVVPKEDTNSMASAESGDMASLQDQLAEADSIGLTLTARWGLRDDPKSKLDWYRVASISEYLSVDQKFGRDLQLEWMVASGWRHSFAGYMFNIELGYAQMESFPEHHRWIAQGGWTSDNLFGEDKAWGLGLDFKFNKAVDGNDLGEDEQLVRLYLHRDAVSLFKDTAGLLLGSGDKKE